MSADVFYFNFDLESNLNFTLLLLSYIFFIFKLYIYTPGGRRAMSTRVTRVQPIEI